MLSSAQTRSPNLPVSLVADPDFRRDLAADPVKTLAAHGIDVRGSQLPAEIRLPDVGDLEALSADPGNGNGNGQGQGNGQGNGPPTNPLGPNDFIWYMFLS